MNRHLLVIILLFITVNSYSDDLHIESFIPSYSPTFIIINDISKILAEVKGSETWQELIQYEKEKVIKDKKETKLDKLKEFMGIDLWNIIGPPSKRVAFVQIDLLSMGKPTIIAELSDPKQFSNQILSNLKESKQEKYKDIDFWSLKNEDIYAFIENIFIYTHGKSAFESLISIYKFEEPSILQEPKYNALINKVSKDNEILIYINSEILNPIIWRLTHKDEMRVFGFYDTKAQLFSINLLDPKKPHEIYVLTENSLLSSMLSYPGNFISTHIIPASNSDIFCALNIGDPEALWENFKASVRDIAGEESYAQLQEDISRFESETKLNFKNDFLNMLSGEVGFAIPLTEILVPEKGSRFSFGEGLMTFYGIKDQDKCIENVERVFSPAQVQKTEYKGVRIQYVPILRGQEGPLGYICVENMLIFSNLKRLQNFIDEEFPLIISDDFAQVSSGNLEPYSMIFFMNLRNFLLSANPHLQADDKALIRIQEIGAIGSFVFNDGQGLVIKIYGSQNKSWLEKIGVLVYSLSVLSSGDLQ